MFDRKAYYERNKEKIKARARAHYHAKRKHLESSRNRRRDAVAEPRSCVVCGAEYRKRHEETLTCSKKCKYELVARKLRGVATCSAEALEQGTEKRLEHPLCGPFVTNCHAKDGWALVSPDGDVYTFRNMSNFVREHKELFDECDIVGCETGNSLAAHQLRRLNPMRRGHIRSWKGWEWKSW